MVLSIKNLLPPGKTDKNTGNQSDIELLIDIVSICCR